MPSPEARERAATRSREAARRRADRQRVDLTTLDRITEILATSGDPYDTLTAIEDLLINTGRITGRRNSRPIC